MLVRYAGIVIETIVEGQGPAVVLLPSLARDSEDYDAVADGLVRNGLRVLRPQPRGIGRSSGPLEDITLHDFARDVAEVIRQLGGGRAVVVGHAYGNWVARMTAVDHPALVRGVAIAAAASKQYDLSLRAEIDKAGDPALPEAVRLAALRKAFFAPAQRPRVVAGRMASHTFVRRSAPRRPPFRRSSGGRGASRRCWICRRARIRSGPRARARRSRTSLAIASRSS